MHRRLPAGLLWCAAMMLSHAALGQPVQVSGAWARAPAPLQDQAAVYATLTSAKGDRLTGVSSPDASRAMLHLSTSQNGMSGMTEMDGLALPPGQKVTLAPHGLHVMLTGLKRPLVAGGRVSLVLTFQHAGRIVADVPVLPIGAAGPAS